MYLRAGLTSFALVKWKATSIYIVLLCEAPLRIQAPLTDNPLIYNLKVNPSKLVQGLLKIWTEHSH